MTKIFTIGFAEKDAQRFFSLLRSTDANHLIDIRLNNISQLAGFTKKNDLKFFLNEILNWKYSHRLEFAPTKDILDRYKSGIINWIEYEREYISLLEARKIKENISIIDFDRAVLLCSEHKPTFCHRRLAAEYLRNVFDQNIEIIHLY